jgi:hypothetical protein
MECSQASDVVGTDHTPDISLSSVTSSSFATAEKIGSVSSEAS